MEGNNVTDSIHFGLQAASNAVSGARQMLLSILQFSVENPAVIIGAASMMFLPTATADTACYETCVDVGIYKRKCFDKCFDYFTEEECYDACVDSGIWDQGCFNKCY